MENPNLLIYFSFTPYLLFKKNRGSWGKELTVLQFLNDNFCTPQWIRQIFCQETRILYSTGFLALRDNPGGQEAGEQPSRKRSGRLGRWQVEREPPASLAAQGPTWVTKVVSASRTREAPLGSLGLFVQLGEEKAEGRPRHSRHLPRASGAGAAALLVSSGSTPANGTKLRQGKSRLDSTERFFTERGWALEQPPQGRGHGPRPDSVWTTLLVIWFSFR